MKIRTSFVANSSSSSFVLLGFEIEKSEVDVRKVLREHFNIDELHPDVEYTLYKTLWNQLRVCFKYESFDGIIDHTKYLIGTELDPPINTPSYVDGYEETNMPAMRLPLNDDFISKVAIMNKIAEYFNYKGELSIITNTYRDG